MAVRGTIDKRGGSDEANLIVSELLPLEDAKSRFTQGVRIRVAEETHGQEGLEKLYEILRGYPGKCELELVIFLADGTRVPMSCERLRVDVSHEMRSRVEALLGPGNLRLVPTSRRTAAPRGNGRSRGR